MHGREQSNNSPKKDTIAGSVDKKDILAQDCISKINFIRQMENAKK